MKLAARDIAGFLKSPDKVSAVLIYGPDQGLMRERSRLIAGHILGKGGDKLNHIEMSAEKIKSDPPLLRDELCAMSLMGGRRLVTITMADDKTAPIIADSFDNLSTTTYLIVEGGDAGSGALRTLFEKDSRFATLPCYRDEGRNLEEVIRGHLTRLELRASDDAFHYLAAHLGNDRAVTASEMEKIALYMGKGEQLSLETAMLLTGHNASESIEDICHAVTTGDIARALGLLVRLLHEGVQPVAIVRSLLKHVQRLDITQARIREGMSPQAAMESLRPKVFFKYENAFRRGLNKLSARHLHQLMNLLLRTEKELKSSVMAAPLLTGNAILQAARLAA